MHTNQHQDRSFRLGGPAAVCNFVMVVLISILHALPAAAQRRKDDTVTMINGNQFTGEIKRMHEGELRISSPYLAVQARLDWKQVDWVESQDLFWVELKDSTRYVGALSKPKDSEPGDRQLLIISIRFTKVIPMSDVVYIRQIRGNFWNSLDGSLSAGFSFTQGNEQLQYNLSTEIEYPQPEYSIGLRLDSLVSTQSGGITTNRHSFGGSIRWNRPNNRAIIFLGDLFRSQQQNLDLRATLGLAWGGHLIRDIRKQLIIFAGAVFSTEDPSDVDGMSEPRRNNVEGIVGLIYQFIKFKSSSFFIDARVFPNVTSFGRVRLDVKVDWRWEIFNDFFLNLGILENYVSDPPEMGRKNDLAITTSLGWTFP